MPNDKKKRNILTQTAWIAKEAGKEAFLNDYTSNISQLVQDTKMISDTLLAGKTRITDVFTDIKKNGGKKFADWFFDRGDEFSDGDLSTGDSDFDAGFDIDDGDGGQQPSQILDADSMKGIARGQVSAMYNIAGKQAEAAMMNASEITSSINGRAGEIVASINNLNKSVISISEKLDSLLKLQSAVAEANAEQSQISEGNKPRGIYNEQGKVTLGSFFNYQKQRVTEMSDTVKMFFDPSQWSPATVLSSIIDMTGIKDKKIFGKSDSSGVNKDDNKVSYNEMMKTINDTLDLTLEKYLTKATEPPAWLKKIPGYDFFGGFVEDLFRGDRGDARRQAADRQSYITDHYTTKDAKFDGIVRQSIVEIIPGYLQQIVGALTGQDFHIDRYGHLSNKQETDIEKMAGYDTSVYSRSMLSGEDRKDLLKGLKADTYTIADKSGNKETKKNPYIDKMTSAATDAAMRSFTFWAIQYFTEEHPGILVSSGLETGSFWEYITRNMKSNINIQGWNTDVMTFYIQQLRYQITNDSRSNIRTARLIQQACDAETKAKEKYYQDAVMKGQIENVPDLTAGNISKLLNSKQTLLDETSNFNEERQKAAEQINAKTQERLKNGAIDETIGDRKFHIDAVAPKIGPLKEKYEKELAEYQQALLENMESSMTDAAGKKLKFSEWQEQLEKKGKPDTSRIDTMSGILSKDAPIPKFHANVIGRLDTIIDLLGSDNAKGKSRVYHKYRKARYAEFEAEEAKRKEAENKTTINSTGNNTDNKTDSNGNNGGENKETHNQDDTSSSTDDEPPDKQDPGFVNEMKTTISQFDIKGGFKELFTAPIAAISSFFKSENKKETPTPTPQNKDSKSTNPESSDQKEKTDSEESKEAKKEKEQSEDAAIIQTASSISTNVSQDGDVSSKDKSLISSVLEHVKNPGLKKIVKSAQAKAADTIKENQEKADKKGGIIGKLFGSAGFFAVAGKLILDFVKKFIAKPFVNIVAKPFLQILKDGITHGFKNVKEGFSELFGLKKKDPEQVKKETDEEKTRNTVQNVIPDLIGKVITAIQNIGKPKPEPSPSNGGTTNDASPDNGTTETSENNQTWYDKLKTKVSGVKTKVANVKTKVSEKLFGTENNRTKLGNFVNAAKNNPVIGAIGKILGPLGKIALGVGQIIASVVMGFAAVKSFSKFVTNVLTKSLKGLEKGVSKILNAVKPIVSIIGNFISKISDFASKIVDSLSGILGTLMSVVGRVLTTILDSLTPFFDAILTVLDTVVDIVTPILDIIIEALSPILDTLGEFLSSVGDIMKDVLAPFVEIIGELLVPVLKLVAPYFELATSALSTVAKFISGTMKTTVVPLLKTIANGIGMIGDSVKWLTSWLKTIGGKAKQLIGKFIAGIGELPGLGRLKKIGVDMQESGNADMESAKETRKSAAESLENRSEKQKEIYKSSILDKDTRHKAAHDMTNQLIGDFGGKLINATGVGIVANAITGENIGDKIAKDAAAWHNDNIDAAYGSKIPDVDPTKVTGSGDESIEYQSSILEEIRDYVAVVPEMLASGAKILKPFIKLISNGITIISGPITIIAKIISAIATPLTKLFGKIGNGLFGKLGDDETISTPISNTAPNIDNSKIGAINIEVSGSGDAAISSDTQKLISVFKPVSEDVLSVLIDIREELANENTDGNNGLTDENGIKVPGGIIDSRTGAMYSDSMTGAGFGASQGANIGLSSTPGSTSEFQNNTAGTYGEKILNIGGLTGVISNIRDNSVSVLKSVKEDRLGIFPVLSASLSPISATLMSFFSAFVKIYLPTIASLVNDIAMPMLKQFVKYHDDYTDFQYKIQLPMLSSVRVNMVPKVQSMVAQMEVLLGAMQSGIGQLLAGQGMLLIALNQPAMGETLFKAAGGLAASGLNVMMSGITAQVNSVSKQLDNTNQPISKLYEAYSGSEPSKTENPETGPTPENQPQEQPHDSTSNGNPTNGNPTNGNPTNPNTPIPQANPVPSTTNNSGIDHNTGFVPPVIDMESVGYHPLTDVTGGGDSQGSYGAFMNMGKRGCGPLALADALVRRGRGNVDPRALTKSMAASGAYSQTRGTSVGGFINYAKSMGAGYQIGGVTTQSLRRASPNNPITLVGSGGGFGTRNGNTHYVNVIGTDSAGGAYVSNPMTGRIEHRSIGDLTAGSIMGLYGSGDIESPQPSYGSLSPYGTSVTVGDTVYRTSNATYHRINAALASKIIDYVPDDTREAINAAYKLWVANNKDLVSTYNTAAKWLSKEIQELGINGFYWPVYTEEERIVVNNAIYQVITKTKCKYENAAITEETDENSNTTVDNVTGGLTQLEAAERLVALKISNPKLYTKLVQAYNQQIASGKLNPDSQPMDWWVSYNSKQFDPKNGNFETFVIQLISSEASSYLSTSDSETSYTSDGVIGTAGFASLGGATNGASSTYKTEYSGNDDERYISENTDIDSLKKESGNPYRAFSESMKKLQNVFNNILSIFTGNENDKIRDVLEEEANKESEQTAREYLGNEAYDNYEPAAYKLYQDDHPQNTNESDENYAARLQAGWTDSVKRKYMKRVTKDDLKKTNGLYQTSMVDAINGVSSSTWGDYDKEKGEWTNSLLGSINYNGVATVNGGIGTLVSNAGSSGSSYATGAAGGSAMTSTGGTSMLAGGYNGATQGAIKHEGQTSRGDAWATYADRYSDTIPNIISQGYAAGMTPAELATIFSTAIWEDSGTKLFGNKSLTATTYDGSGQRADGIMNWVESDSKGGTVQEQLNYIKRRYFSSTPMSGKTSSGTYRQDVANKNGASVFNQMTGRNTGYTLNVGDRYYQKLNTDLTEGSSYFFQGDLAPAKAFTSNGLAEYVGTAIGAYNWLLKNGYGGSSYDNKNQVDSGTSNINLVSNTNQSGSITNGSELSANTNKIGSTVVSGAELEQNSDSDYWAGRVWNLLKNEGFSDAGAAGVMGNFYRESLMIPYLAEGKGYAPPYQGSWDYTLKADAGGSFVGDSVGYGLAQWTNSSRKQTLLDNAKELGSSVGSLNAQFATLREELSSTEKSAASVKSATDPVQASQDWQRLFERAGVVAQSDRDNAAKKYFDQYAGTMGTDMGISSNGTMMNGSAMIGNGYQFKNNEYLDIWDDTAMLQTPEKRGFGGATRNGGFINYASAAAGGIKNRFIGDTEFSKSTLGVVQSGGLSGGMNGVSGNMAAGGALNSTASGYSREWLDVLLRSIAATDGKYDSYSMGGYAEIELDGKKVVGSPDCTGMFLFPMDYFGYTYKSISGRRSTDMCDAAESTRYPFLKDGQPTQDFVAYRWGSEVGSSDVIPGDILVKTGHGEVGAGVKDGKLYGWNFGSTGAMNNTQRAAKRQLAGEDLVEASAAEGVSLGADYRFLIRPTFGTLVGTNTSTINPMNSQATNTTMNALSVDANGDEGIPEIDINKLNQYTDDILSHRNLAFAKDGTSIVKTNRSINNNIIADTNPQPQVINNNTTYQIQRSDKVDNERMDRLMKHTFNVSAERVEALLEKILDKMDTMTGKKESDITDALGPNNSNMKPFPNDDIPIQIQRLAKG